MAAQNMATGQKHKQQAPCISQNDWTTRERLILASSVVRSGDQNWISVSRAIKPIAEEGSARPRPPDFFSQKNCAVHYSNMLEKVSMPKRKRSEGGGAETPGDQIVRTLSFERMEELKKSIKSDHLQFRKVNARIEDIKNGKLDYQLQAMCKEIEARRKRKEEMQSKAGSSQVESGATLPATPTTPTPVTPLPGGSRPGVQSLPLAQKGKQQRIPKPTEKFQKYQQQQRQRHGHASQPAQYPGQPSDAMTSSGLQPDGLSNMPGIEQAALSGTQILRRESTESEGGSEMSAASHNQSVTPTGAPPSPWKHEPVPHSPAISPDQQTPVGTSQVPGESALLNLLSQPPKDLKQAVFELSEQGQTGRTDSGQHPTSSAPYPQPGMPAKEDSKNSDGKPFLGVGPSVEPKKLDSIRDRRASTSQVPAVAASVATPSVSAPTLSKLLTSVTSSGTLGFNASPLHITTPKSSSVTKASFVSEAIGCVDGNSLLGRRGGGITVDGHGEGGGAQVTTLSFSPKTAIKAALPSPMAITPPPNTPPADKKQMNPESLVEAEEKITTVEHSAVSETADVKCEESVRPANTSKDLGEELKVDGGEVVKSTPKMATRTRASKPGRPGRPPKIVRKPPQGRTKSLNSTDNELEVEESQATAEAMQVESENVCEKGEKEKEPLSTLEDKKDENTVDEEEGEEAEQEDDGEEEGSLDDGDRSQSGEAMRSLKELIEKQDLTGTESVPASPSSQVSVGSGDDPEAIQAQKTWRKSIMLVWRAAANHKYANVFLHPVTDDEAPGYHTVVFRPMDITTIKKSIENGTIRTTSEFQRDMMLMFQNALMYNNSDHDVYHMAEEMRDDVMEQIQSYIATQLMVRSSDRESKMLRGHRTDVFHFFL